MNHPKNKFERRLIASKKSKKKRKGKAMRTIELSQEHTINAMETYLFSLRLIDADEQVKLISPADPLSPNFLVSVERPQEELLN